MFSLRFGEGSKLTLRSGLVISGLFAVLGTASAQTTETNPGLFDLSTSYADFAARASLEFNPPTRSNVWILGNSSTIAEEGTRATNPWASVLGQPQAFELNYNVDSGDLSWTILGKTLNANYLLQSGYGLAYLQPLIKIQTPNGAQANIGKMDGFEVSVNGGSAQSYGLLQASGTGNAGRVIYFDQYDIHTVKVTGNISFDIPETWSDEINGSYADVEFLSAKPVPEPASMAVLGVGVLAAFRKRRKNANRR